MNMDGEKVKEMTVKTNTDTEIQLNVPEGLYILTVNTPNGRLYRKINIVK